MNEQVIDTKEVADRAMTDLLSDLAIVRQAKAGLKTELDLVNGEEERLKDEIFSQMQAQSITGCEGSGLKVSLRTTTRKSILDMGALELAVYVDGSLEDFVSTQVVFDSAGAMALALERGWDCVEVTKATSLVVAGAK